MNAWSEKKLQEKLTYVQPGEARVGEPTGRVVPPSGIKLAVLLPGRQFNPGEGQDALRIEAKERRGVAYTQNDVRATRACRFAKLQWPDLDAISTRDSLPLTIRKSLPSVSNMISHPLFSSEETSLS